MKWTLPVLTVACLTPAAGLTAAPEPAGAERAAALRTPASVAAARQAFRAPAAGHHAIGEIYDEERTVVLDGEVEAFLFGNPHSILHVRVVDAGGRRRTWAVEWRAADRLSRAGLRGDELAQGDLVTLCGHPGRDPGAFRLYLLNVARRTAAGGPAPAERAALCDPASNPEIGALSRR